MLERFINILSQLIHIMRERYIAFLQKYGYIDEPNRPSICMSERISETELECEFQAAIPRLEAFGLTAVKINGVIAIQTLDQRHQDICPQRFTRIVLKKIVNTSEGHPCLPIEGISNPKLTVQLRSVKMEGYFAIEEFLPQGRRYVEMWSVQECVRKKSPEGLTAFFADYHPQP